MNTNESLSAFSLTREGSAIAGYAAYYRLGILFAFGGDQGGSVVSSGWDAMISSSPPVLENWNSTGTVLTSARIYAGFCDAGPAFYVAVGRDPLPRFPPSSGSSAELRSLLPGYFSAERSFIRTVSSGRRWSASSRTLRARF